MYKNMFHYPLSYDIMGRNQYRESWAGMLLKNRISHSPHMLSLNTNTIYL